MTSDTTTPPKPKQKRNRKLPRRAILDADFVVPSSQRAIDDLLMERAPSQHDRIILSELWGGNDSHFQKSIMPAVSIGKPKRSLHGDTLAKPKTYKDMLKEKHKDDWAMDLSNVTFVPPTVQGKHIRSSTESTPPATETSDESASELETDNMASLDESDVPVDQPKDQKSDGANTENVASLDAGSQGKADEKDTSTRLDIADINRTEHAPDKDITERSIDSTGEITSIPIANDTGKDNESTHQGEEPNIQDKDSPSLSGNYDAGGQEDTGSTNTTPVSAAADETLHGEDIEQGNDYMPSYSDDECIVDQDIVEKLRQTPVITEQDEGGSNDLSKSEISPTTTDDTTSKEEIPPQEPLSAETNPSISSSTEYIQEQWLVPEACLSGDNVGDVQDHHHQDELKQMEILPSLDSTTGNAQASIPSAKDQQKLNIPPLDDTTVPSNDDKPESNEDQELMEIGQDGEEQPLEIVAPVSRQMLVSGTQNSAMISDKVSQMQAKKPLLNLDQPVYEETDLKIKSNPKIIKKWQPNQKHHLLMNALKDTTALNWIEDGHDDIRKKNIGLARKRQLEARFSKPFVTKKRFKNCWFVETSNHE